MSSGSGVGEDVPLAVRTQFAHAVVQSLADAAGVDVLHLKGVATDPDLRTRPAGGIDADVLVRPGQEGVRLDSLWRHGWRRLSSFETGSPFEHAVTAGHPQFVHADIHRWFPGMDRSPGTAFEELWAARRIVQIAGVDCSVPSREGQVLIRVLNTASGDEGPILDLVHRTGAEVAFAAAIGDLERYRGLPEYRLWKVTVQGGTRTQEWWARVRARPGVLGKARLVARAPLVNVDHLRNTWGREPTKKEILREFVSRPSRGLRQELRRWALRGRPGRVGR